MLKEGVFSFEVDGALLRNRNQSHSRLNGLAFPHNIRVTSSGSYSWRKQWKVTDSVTLKIFKPTRRDS